MRIQSSVSDSDLIAGILDRDENALELLFDRYAEPLRWHLVSVVHSEVAAQDVLQETFLRVWTRAEQWQGDGPFRAWLYRIATNLALNHLRAVQRRRELPLEIPPDIDDDDEVDNRVPAWMIDAASLGPEAAVEAAEERARCRQLLDRLPEEKREVLRLVHEMEMSLREAADALAIPEGTVKSRLHYTRARLAREWTQERDKGGHDDG
jgi:RNA polymerase sigma-70 factor, ECF subfamily